MTFDFVELLGGCCDPQPLPPLGAHITISNQEDVGRMKAWMFIAFDHPERIEITNATL